MKVSEGTAYWLRLIHLAFSYLADLREDMDCLSFNTVELDEAIDACMRAFPARDSQLEALIRKVVENHYQPHSFGGFYGHKDFECGHKSELLHLIEEALKMTDMTDKSEDFIGGGDGGPMDNGKNAHLVNSEEADVNKHSKQACELRAKRAKTSMLLRAKRAKTSNKKINKEQEETTEANVAKEKTLLDKETAFCKRRFMM